MSCGRKPDNCGYSTICNTSKNIVEIKGLDEMKKNIQIIVDSVQTFTEVTNLFNDVDKNRTNLEDKLNKMEQTIVYSAQTFTDVINLFNDVDKNRNNLEDKLNNLEQSTNNRLDKLEQSINQIISMLQKS